MNVTHKCIAITNYIIEELNKYNANLPFREQVSIITKRLQKLLYFCDIEYMKENNGTPMFTDEFHAWPSGPVIPDLYRLYMPDLNGNMWPYKIEGLDPLTKEEKIIVDQILLDTMNFDTIDLVNVCIFPGSSHNRVFTEDDPNHSQIVSKKESYEFYYDKKMLPQMTQEEIVNLDNEDLQLRYILGSLYPQEKLGCNMFWVCDLKCNTYPVSIDDNFKKVRHFIDSHNISNSTFLRLARTYLSGSLDQYDGNWGTFIPELVTSILEYDFADINNCTTSEDNFNERELLELIQRETKTENGQLNNFLKHYNLTITDFIILASTNITCKFKSANGFSKTDLIHDLENILKANALYQPLPWINNNPFENAKNKMLVMKQNHPNKKF